MDNKINKRNLNELFDREFDGKKIEIKKGKPPEIKESKYRFFDAENRIKSKRKVIQCVLKLDEGLRNSFPNLTASLPASLKMYVTSEKGWLSSAPEM